MPSAFANDSFPTKRPDDWLIERLSFYKNLSGNGDVYRKCEVILCSETDGLSHYSWRVPLLKDNQIGVYAISVKNSSGESLKNKISYYDKNGNVCEKPGAIVAKIDINFPPLKINEHKIINIEYYVKEFAEKVSSNPFFSKWRVDWKYNVHSKMNHFEYRIILPSKSKSFFDSIHKSSGDLVNFTFEDKEIIIWSDRDLPQGTINGSFSYDKETPMARAICGVISGLLIALLASVVKGDVEFSTALVLSTSSIGGVFLSYYLISKFLPTTR